MGEVKRVVRFKRNIQKPFIIRVSAAHGFPTINRLLFFEALGFVFVLFCFGFELDPGGLS